MSGDQVVILVIGIVTIAMMAPWAAVAFIAFRDFRGLRRAARREAQRGPTLKELLGEALKAKRELNAAERKSWDGEYLRLKDQLLPCTCRELPAIEVRSFQGGLLRTVRQFAGQEECEAHRPE